MSQYTSDLRHFAQWVEASGNNGQEHAVLFDPTQMTTPTVMRYREFMQTIRALKPATVNSPIKHIETFFSLGPRTRRDLNE